MICYCPNCEKPRDLRPSRARLNPLCRSCNMKLKAQPLGDLATADRKRELGRKGYERTAELYGDEFMIEKHRQKRLAKPSKPERMFIAALEQLNITDYEREVVIKTQKYTYIYDFYLWTGRDFYYVEVDGEYYHQQRTKHDARKARLIEQRGVNFLRFSDKEVYAHDFIARLAAILEVLS